MTNQAEQVLFNLALDAVQKELVAIFNKHKVDFVGMVTILGQVLTNYGSAAQNIVAQQATQAVAGNTTETTTTTATSPSTIALASTAEGNQAA